MWREYDVTNNKIIFTTILRATGSHVQATRGALRISSLVLAQVPHRRRLRKKKSGSKIIVLQILSAMPPSLDYIIPFN